MTDGEKMIWAAAFVAAFNEHAARGLDTNAAAWRTSSLFVHATSVAAKRATLTVEALRRIETDAAEALCDGGEMLRAVLECDP